MSSLADLTGGPSRSSRPIIARGSVARGAAAVTDPITAVLENFSALREFEIVPGHWMPRAGLFPQRGDECMLAFDDDGDAWMPAWMTNAPPVDYVTEVELDAELAAYATSASVVSALAAYATNSALALAVPTGVIFDWSLSSAPTGFQLCDGGDAATTALDTLLKNNSEPYGHNAATNKAKVPDARGRALVGSGTGAGLSARAIAATGGEETHLLTTAEMPAHSHGYITRTGNYTGGTNAGATGSNVGTLSTTPEASTIANSGGGGVHQNMPPFLVVARIIKT